MVYLNSPSVCEEWNISERKSKCLVEWKCGCWLRQYIEARNRTHRLEILQSKRSQPIPRAPCLHRPKVQVLKPKHRNRIDLLVLIQHQKSVLSFPFSSDALFVINHCFFMANYNFIQYYLLPTPAPPSKQTKQKEVAMTILGGPHSLNGMFPCQYPVVTASCSAHPLAL